MWHDQNANGIQDAGEPGIVAVTLHLLKASDNSVLATTTTGAGGLYQFGGLCAGGYRVEMVPPAGYTASPATQGLDRENDSNPNPASVTLAADNASDQSIDFGVYKLVAIGDLVWEDLIATVSRTATSRGSTA